MILPWKMLKRLSFYPPRDAHVPEGEELCAFNKRPAKLQKEDLVCPGRLVPDILQKHDFSSQTLHS